MENKNLRLQYRFNKLKSKHSYFKLEKGPCLYLIYDGDTCGKSYNDMMYKIGITDNIHKRLQTYRTSIPCIKIARLIYCNQCKEIENYIKFRFSEKLKPHNNHEWISGISCDVIFKRNKFYFRTFVVVYSKKVKIIDKYNKCIQLICDDKHKNSDDKDTKHVISMMSDDNDMINLSKICTHCKKVKSMTGF